MAGEPAFVELGVADTERARTFYGQLFGWTFSPGPSGAGYMIQTSGIPAGLHGGDEGASPYVFFRVDDLDAATAAVRDLGGTFEPIAGDGGGGDESVDSAHGRFTLCRDDQGSSFGLFQPPDVV
jgi:predicted enzyme related to lactoylglutathione lyase